MSSIRFVSPSIKRAFMVGSLSDRNHFAQGIGELCGLLKHRMGDWIESIIIQVGSRCTVRVVDRGPRNPLESTLLLV